MASLILSPAEQDYITKGVESGIRADGRGVLDRREMTLRTGMISQANGSARCRIGNLGVGTDVLVGVKADVATWTPGDAPDRGSIVCSVECSPSAAQEFEGRGAEALNVELTQMLDRILNNAHGGIDLTKLCIIPEQAYWVLNVDALVLDVKGNIIDVLVCAARAALVSTMLPRVVVETIADENGDVQAEFDVVDDPEDMVEVVGARDIPIAVTFSHVGRAYAVDASDQEEAVAHARLTVAVSPSGEICGVQKGGALRGFSPSLLIEILQTAKRLAKEEVARFDVHYEESRKIAGNEEAEPSIGSTFLSQF